ncbi:amidohydrolase family protein [Alteraurantiacibacter aquimixticola]|uniref:Amidohydrolase-related domain-containing protein n=1 Tax=Alteraurantiacibacter aquimixticola TaxID=2489173 RepID=A0A4V4U881_9SPHN|nr:amidohydrolase family protein [Alteraurantiacibacter aquimixticola]TIX48827.1 hypothetical protein E5222_13860 [Alteraurantiacibacter aquimixticola]
MRARNWTRLAAACLLFAAPPLAAQDRLLLANIGPENRYLLIEDGAIATTGDAADMPPVEGSVQILDAQGLFAHPGLIDMHVHVWGEAELSGYLAYGVTTVRNLSGMPFHLRMAEEIAAGELAGPRLYTSGPILNSPGPNAQINHQMVLTEEEGRAAVRAQHEAGYDRIKVYSNLNADAWSGVLAEAQALGMAITGHTPEGERLEGIPQVRPFQIPHANLLDAGFETFEHTETIYFHGLRDSWDAEAARILARDIAASGTPVTPTLVAHRNLVHMAESDGAFAQREGVDWLNPVLQALEAEVTAFWSAQDPANERERAGHYAEFTRIMQREGVLLVAGSDAGIFVNVPGRSLVDELELLVEAGLTSGEALASATGNAAKVLGEEERLGCLDEGCAADIVLYPCDPQLDIACLRQPALVIAAGRPHAVDELAAKAVQHDVEQIGTDLLEGMAAQGTPLDPAMLGM